MARSRGQPLVMAISHAMTNTPQEVESCGCVVAHILLIHGSWVFGVVWVFVLMAAWSWWTRVSERAVGVGGVGGFSAALSQIAPFHAESISNAF